MYYVKSKITASILIVLCAALSSCMVGPNFRKPPAPAVKKYSEPGTPLPKKTVSSKVIGGEQQTFLTDADIPLAWWELYHSEAINKLIRAGLKNSPNLAAASAAIAEARENVKEQIGSSLFPAIDTVNRAQRQRYSTVAIAGGNNAATFNLYNPTLALSYTFDVFGGARREIESLRAQVDYQQFELLGAYLTLTSDIVTTAVSIASFQEQIRATQDLIKIQTGVFEVLNKQFQLGGIAKSDVLTQQTTLEQTKATLPPLQNSLSQAKHALSALVGEFPDGPLPEIQLATLKLPKNIPVSLPSNLIQQRPDIRASEALLHAACAQVGVATANLLPQLSMTSNYGWINTSLNNLFIPQHVVWSTLGQAAQPLFRGGSLLAARRASIAAYQQAAAQYKQTVLVAFQNVADSLRAIETDARTLQAQVRAENSAREALNLTMTQYRLGGINYINLLNAQNQYQQARINRIQAQAARFTDTALLFHALGGGWWHKPWCVKECA